MTDRKFYRTVIEVAVLSESPLGPVELNTLHYMITEGDCSGQLTTVRRPELNGKEDAEELLDQGSDPYFCNLDYHGNDVD